MKTTSLFLLLVISNFLNAQEISKTEFYELIEKENYYLTKENEIIYADIKVINDLIPTISDSITKMVKIKEVYKLWEIADHNSYLALKNRLKIADKYPNSEHSLNVYINTIGSQSAMTLIDEYEKAYGNLNFKMKNSEKGIIFKDALDRFKKSSIGSQAPNFELIDQNGKTIKLNDLKGKIILIDFWASWCGPCLEEMPYLKKLYAEYSKIGLEIIGISRDDDLDKWKNYINDNQLKWTNISVKENKSEIEKDYFVYGIPHKVLIDQNGKIIGKWKGSGYKNMESIRMILEENLNE